MSQSKKLATLKRRLLFLERRLTSNDYSENSMAFLKAEIAALYWAIGIIENWLLDNEEDEDSPTQTHS
jgi:hypothetical protein